MDLAAYATTYKVPSDMIGDARDREVIRSTSKVKRNKIKWKDCTNIRSDSDQIVTETRILHHIIPSYIASSSAKVLGASSQREKNDSEFEATASFGVVGSFSDEDALELGDAGEAEPVEAVGRVRPVKCKFERSARAPKSREERVFSFVLDGCVVFSSALEVLVFS